MKRTLLALIAAIVSLGSAGPLSACTSAVISGKVTPTDVLCCGRTAIRTFRKTA